MAKKILTLLMLLLCAASLEAATGTVVKSASSMTRTGTYRITKELKASNIKIGDNSTIIFEGGRITGAKITAKNLKIVVPDSKMYFNNCTLSGNIIDSKLKATNFGCKADMSTLYKSKWSYKGLPQQTIGYRTGTDNFKAMERIATFLKGSTNVNFEWNGAFFTAHQPSAAIYAPPYIRIEGCKKMVMHGGVLISGIRFVDCSNVEVSNMAFMGYHECHDFPPVHTSGNPSKAITLNGVAYTVARAGGKLEWAGNCYYYGSDGTKDLGLAAEGVVFDTSAPNKTASGINIHDCHFEMRLNGVVIGMKRNNYAQMGKISNARIADCTFSHHYFQPIGMRAENVTVENVSGDYALQPIDISTLSHNVVVRNASFTDLFYGPKQESDATYANQSYGNRIENSKFVVNGKYKLVGYDSYAFNASEGRVGDTFIVKNTTFDFSTGTYGTMAVRTCADRLLFENCTFMFNLKKQTDASSQYCIMSIFAAFSTKATSPKVDFVNTDIEVNGSASYSGGKTSNPFAYLFSKVGAKSYSVSLDKCKVHGTARVDWSLFEQMESVVIKDSQISIGGCDSHGYYINAPKKLQISGSTIDARLGKYNTLVGMPKSNDYSHDISNTTVDASVSKLFTTSPDKKRSRVSNVKTRTTGRSLTK